MKFYSEEEMKALRLGLEEKILGWPQVRPKRMFGCPCYQAKGKLFAFLVTMGIVITQLPQAEREAVARQHPTAPFKAGRRTVQSWVRATVRSREELDGVLPFVRKSYEAVLEQP